MRTCASFSHDVRTTARDAAILGEGLVGDGQAGRLWEWPLFSFFLPVVRPLHCGSDAWAITNKERRKKSNAAALCVGFAPGACMHALAARAAPPILGGRPCRVHACCLRFAVPPSPPTGSMHRRSPVPPETCSYLVLWDDVSVLVSLPDDQVASRGMFLSTRLFFVFVSVRFYSTQ